MKKQLRIFPPLCCFCLPECVTGFTFIDVIFPSRGRGREAQTPTSSHLALIPCCSPRIDDVPSDKGLTPVWVSNGERWLLKDRSGARLSSQQARGGGWGSTDRDHWQTEALDSQVMLRLKEDGERFLRAGEASEHGCHGFCGCSILPSKRNIKIFVSCIDPGSCARAPGAAAFRLISIPASDLLCHLRQII